MESAMLIVRRQIHAQEFRPDTQQRAHFRNIARLYRRASLWTLAPSTKAFNRAALVPIGRANTRCAS